LDQRCVADEFGGVRSDVHGVPLKLYGLDARDCDSAMIFMVWVERGDCPASGLDVPPYPPLFAKYSIQGSYGQSIHSIGRWMWLILLGL
jgi:hypothetical protein